jgi:DNA-binding LacI/PurR family transcriptional regulator
MALGVHEKAGERGLVTGKNIAFAGFDNRDVSRGTNSKRFHLPCTLHIRPPV